MLYVSHSKRLGLKARFSSGEGNYVAPDKNLAKSCGVLLFFFNSLMAKTIPYAAMGQQKPYSCIFSFTQA